MIQEQQYKDAFSIIGISVRTSNAGAQAAADIPALWERFMSENIQAKIPGLADTAIYSVYTDYESDYTGAYTTVIGCRVESLDYIPEGMTGLYIEAGPYMVYQAKGNLQQGIVYRAWTEIWNSSQPRAYKSDFEIYGQAAANPEDAEVPIFVSLKQS